MLSEKLKSLVPLVPFFALALLALIHTGAMAKYFSCALRGCDSIPDNVKNIFVIADAKSRKTGEKDTWEVIEKKGIPESEIMALTYSGRLTSSFLGMAYLIVCLTALGIGIFVFYKSMNQKGQGRFLWLLAAIGILVATSIVLCHHPAWHMPVLNQLGSDTIDKDVAGITKAVNRLNSFGYAVGLFMSLTMCAILTRTGTHQTNHTLKQLSIRMKYLNLILYVSTLMLIVGVLLEKAIFQWSLAFISRDEHIVKAAENFLAGLLAFDGGYYTLLLAALYLPAASILGNRAAQIAENDSKRLKRYGLNFSVAESLPRMFAILGPLLAGPIVELFGRLAK